MGKTQAKSLDIIQFFVHQNKGRCSTLFLMFEMLGRLPFMYDISKNSYDIDLLSNPLNF